MPVTLGKWLGNLEQVIYLCSVFLKFPISKVVGYYNILKDVEKSAL